MDDYLRAGKVKNDLEILKQSNGVGSSGPKYVAPMFTESQLYLKGYGRDWGVKMTYSVGLAYGSGLLVGGTIGLAKGISKGGATRKLFINSVLNSCGTYGPGVGNRTAGVTILYCIMNNIISLARSDEKDIYNSALSGLAAGALYRCAGSWKSIAKYSIGSAAAFSAIDYALRNSLV
ncbi:putative mitochondrial import inner membrane protein [Babesia divergens]|uniref:Mitochondrial import inner membrane protein n=1 Tax=Babesia divergens TaxID=32595 RepID=A0AAD9LI93_BABDI|nr:putative mitochondrial import inner membrane protein [Babesia divergens]